MNFARYLMLLPLAAGPSLCAQETAPAPVVRTAATQTAAPAAAAKPHLTTAFPIARPQQSAAAAATPSKPSSPAPATPRPAQPSGTAAIATLPGSAFNRTVVVLDPGHGGSDTGSRMNDQLTEKEVTLALAFKIRSLLTARGFTVVMTREADVSTTDAGSQLSLDDRAGIANHARPVACLLLHATASGRGVHLYTSELAPIAAETLPAPWLTAQAAYVAQSQKLASALGSAIQRGRLPLVSNSASIRPVDSLTCPAVVLELAPSSSEAASLNDTSYQQRVAEAVAGTMVFWQNQAQAPARALPPTPPTTTPAASTGGRP